MFYVKTILKQSSLHGIGLFADEDVAFGTLVFEESQTLTIQFSKDQFVQLSNEEQKIVKHYGYIDKQTDLWHLNSEDIRFSNHEKDGNMTLRDGKLYALRDIVRGEELTQDYSEFEELRDGLY
jgi:hypothetical protein